MNAAEKREVEQSGNRGSTLHVRRLVKFCNILVILILVSVALFRLFVLISPSITGFAVLQSSYSQDLNLTISQNSEQAITLQHAGELSSFKISGNVIGKGIVRVYLKADNARFLIFDNSLNKNNNLITANVVAEELNAAVNETANLAENTITNETTNTVSQNLTENLTINHAPEWVAEISSFVVDQGTSSILNLSTYFSDADNDTISYLASSNENVDVVIDNFVSLMTVTPNPEFAGNTSIMLFAGDGKELTTKEVTITVAPAAITRFEFECIETCLLNNVSAGEMTLAVEVENASLAISSIDYNVFETVLNEPISNLSNISITKQNITNITNIANITNETIINETTPALEITNITIRKFKKTEVKDNFKASENAEFEVEFVNETELIKENKPLSRKSFEKKLNKWIAENETVEARVIYNFNNEKANFDVEIEEAREGRFFFNVIKPRQFRPGLYTLEVNFTRSGETTIFSQDFAWGVLAINTHKSIYLPDELAEIGIAVLDNEGRMVCNADVELEITDANGVKTTLTTPDGITVTEACYNYDINKRADYAANYTVNSAGTYLINLTAVTSAGTWNIEDNFTVADAVDFDVSRPVEQTRIYPAVSYTMNLTIIANQNYDGLINEYIPASFEITPQAGLSINTVGSTKVLSWDVKLKKNDVVNLAYEYNAPDISPEFYLLGKLNIGSWQESRHWQIASDAIGVQHNFAWGLDLTTSSTMGRRSNTGNDVSISIKAGSTRGSDTDPILRLQIVNTAAITSGERLGLYFTDCTGGVLKTCAGRAIGTDPATQFVAVEKQDGTNTSLFRFREASHASVIGGNQHSGVVGLTEHNPPAGAWAEGNTTVAYSIANFTGSSYNAHDFSFEYYGSAPSVRKTYVFAGTYNETKPSWSGMHGQTGAILDVLPSPWNGSAIAEHGVSITGNTTATATHIFTDDNNTNSNTTFSYSANESGTYIIPSGCSQVTGGYNTHTFQDGTTGHKRTCNITGLAPNTLYFFMMNHTDADGIAGNAVEIEGPFYTNQTKAAVHMHVSTKDSNDTTTDDEGDLKEDDAAAIVTTLATGDGQYTLLRAKLMQIDSWTPQIPANATIDSVEFRYQWAMNNVPETAQNLYRADPGTEPSRCGGSGGTNWTLIEALPNSVEGWIAERVTTISGYTIAQLEALDLCLNNTNSGGAAASDVVAFDFISIIPIYIPATSGSGAPNATTDAATLLGETQAQLNAIINTQGISGKAYFEYGLNISYGSYAPASDGEYVYNTISMHAVEPISYYRTVSGLSSGTTYHYRACLKSPPDATATCGADQALTTSDTTLPSVLQQYPANNSATSNTLVTFNCSATDNSNLANISLWANFTGAWALNDSWCNVTGTAASCQWNKTLPSNTYIWGCRAFDAANNSNWTSQNWTITVDTIAPNVSLVSPADGTSSTLTSFTFNASGTDRELSNATFYWNYSGTWLPNGTQTMSGTSGSANFTRNNLAVNSYIWNVQFCDSAGQCNFSLSNYTLTITAPATYCAGNYTQGQATWNITSNITCANQTIYVAGNITIFNNGSLTLYNVTINFSAFADGSNFINKSPNGGLWIYDLDSNASTQEDATEIISNNSDYEYNFWVFGNNRSDNFTIQNSIIKDAGYSTKSLGIRLYSISNVTISGNNIIGGAQYGLYLLYSSNNNITSNAINTTASSGYGIYLFTSSNSNSNIIQNNTIITNGTNGYGIYLDISSTSNIVQSNTITTSGSNGHGIYLFSSSNSNITNNAITTNGSNGRGIYLYSSSNSRIQGNTITTNGSGGYGIYLDTNSQSNIMQNNTITTNGSNGYGIYLWSNSYSNNITNNAITTNGTNGYGIYLVITSDSNIVQSNTITTTGSSGRGIYLDTSSNNNATSNIIAANGSNADGIYILGNSDSNIFNFNNISKSGRDGIRTEGSATNLPERNNITNNIILNATEHGIFANNTLTASQLIQGNNISYSGNFSILLSNASNITIIGGSLEYSKIGVNATSSINVTVTNATFGLNTLWDFYITNNSWVISINNSFNSSVNVTNIPNDYSNFTVMWYARANVTNSSGIHMNSSSVTSTDVLGGTDWTDTTTNGLTGWFAATDYIQNGTAAVSYNLHTAEASLTGYLANSSTYNVSVKNITGTQVDIVLKNPQKFCNGNYTEGQISWNITSNVTCANQTIYVAGNITIFNNGSLTLYNVTINFSAFADGSNFINKSPNGGLFIYDLDSNASTEEDGSRIMSNDSNYEYDFWAFGNGLNDNLTIRNSKFTDAGYSTNSQGIQLYNVSNVVVSGNNVSEGAYYGLYLQYSANNNLSNNNINTTAINGYGIYLSSSNNSNISSNTITTSGNLGYGIYLSSSSNSNTLASNTITTSGSLSGYGIYLSSSNNSNISSNTITTSGSSGFGIYLQSSSNTNIVSSNTITTNGSSGMGIYLVSSSNTNIVSSNTITTSNADAYGIYLQSSSNSNTLQSNTITTNGSNGYGILLSSSSITNILSNIMNTTGTNADGIYVFSNSDNNILNLNNISKSGRDGIRIENSGTNLPEQNNITNNIILNATEHGIFANNTLNAYQLIQGNNISYSGNISILLRNASNITIIGGSLEYSKIGINATLSKNITVTNATFILNTLWDFYITNNSWIISINNSFNKSGVNVTNALDDYSNFTNQYYVDVNVTQADSSFSAVSGASVYAYENTTGSWAQEWTESTGTNGFTGKWATTEYVQNGTTIVNYTSNFTATKLTKANSTVKYITSSQQVDVRIPAPTKFCNGNYTEGQVSWNITSNLTCANETIYVAGNITIFNNGSLTLYNVTINFSMFADGSSFINKSPNGGLYIYDLDSNLSTQEDATEIISNDSNYEYDFWVYGNGNNDNFTMQNSIIKDAGYSSNSQGMQLYNISNVKVIGNNISDGAYYGLYLQFSTNNNISGNTIISSVSSAYTVWLVSRSNSNILSNNTVTRSGGFGFGIIVHLNSVSNTLQGNIVRTFGSSDTGISLQASSNSNTLLSNTIITNVSNSYGIRFDASSSNNITSNTITTNGSSAYGIFFSSSSNSNIIESNTITTNGSSGWGIYLASNSNSNTIQSNTITTNGSAGYGIYFDTSSNNNATSNIINATNANGVYIWSNSDNNILNLNNISKSGRDGIRVENSGTSLPERNNITNNIILNSTEHGIFLNNTLTAFQLMQGNNISYSGNFSILLNNASNITIIGGSLEYSKLGINATRSRNVTVANTTFVLNTLWDFYVTNNSWVISLNNSFNKSGVNVTNYLGDFSNFTNQYYVDVNVTYSNSTAASGATVFTYENSTGSWTQQWSDTTATNGFTGKWATTEYFQNGTSIINYTSNFTANYTTSANSTIKYITSSQQIDVRIQTPTVLATYCNGNYTEGQATWDITGNITCANQTIYVAGNITIFNNGSLTLYNVTINFSAFADGSNFINKSPNGGLFIYDLDSNRSTQEDATEIISNNSDYEYSFWVYGNSGNDNFTMQNSIVKDAGYGSGSLGIRLTNVNNTIILNNNITGGAVYGLYLVTSGNNNLTGNFIDTTANSGVGIYLDLNSNINNITGNTITTSGNYGYGIYLLLVSNSTMQGNTITTSGNSGVGIYLYSSSNNNATSNIINATGANADGIYIFIDSDSNILSLNNISKSGRDGIRLENSGASIPERNNITGNIILNSTEHGIFFNNTKTASALLQNNNISYSGNASISLNNASNITIIGGSLEYSKIGINATLSKNITVTNATFVLNTLWDFYISNNSWVISINNSFNSSVNVTDIPNDYSNFTVMWYARANVTNSSGIHMNSSSVTSTDANSNTEWTNTTTNGLTGWFAVIDYIQNGTSTVSYNLHTASASGVSGHFANSSTYNVSIKNITGTQVDIVLKNARKFCNDNYTEGSNWVVSRNITCANESIPVGGNITIFNNGSLTLYNVTINFSAFADGSNFINKSPNGGLYIYDLDSNRSTQEDATEIMSNNSDYDYNFWVYGNGNNDNFTMQNSIVKDAGYSTKSQGIQLYNTSNVIISGNNISEGYYGLFIRYSANDNISNNAINTAVAIGINLGSSSNSTISSNIITTSGLNAYGIDLSSSSNQNTIQNNTITTSGSQGYGIYLATSSNTNVSGNTITTNNTNGHGIYLDTTSTSNTVQSNTITANGSSGRGIFLLTSNSNIVQSNTITTNGSSGHGLFLSSSSNINISRNIITTNGSNSYGIYLLTSSNNNATSNIIAANGSNADGIYILGNSDNNIFNLNNISKSGRDGIRIENSGTNIPEQNNITNNIILNATEHGIFANNTLNAFQLIQGNNISYSGNFSILLLNASNITAIGGSLEYSKIGMNATNSINVTITNASFVLNSLWDFYITNNSWVISLNNSFNSSINVTNRAGDYSNFTVMWYARANVTNSSGIHMNSSSVTSTDVNSATDWTDTTTNGLTGWFAAIDYIQNGTAAVSYNLHTAEASLTGYLANSSTYNVSVKNITGTQVDIVLKNQRKFCNGNYTEGQATWSITSNITCANETIYVAGNITIFNNGSLTLYNVTINFSAFADGSNFINKSPNGGLFIYDLDSNASTQEDATEIISNNSDYEYDFWVYGNGNNDNFTMQNSIVKDAGSNGIQLYNVSNVKIVGNNISDGARYGLYLQYSISNNITSNTINTTEINGYGIYLTSSSNSNTLLNNIITTDGITGIGIWISSSSNSTVQSNTITTSGACISLCSYGIVLEENSNIQSNTITTSNTNGWGIYLWPGSNSNITNNTITTSGSSGYGVYLSSSSNSTLQSNTITTSNTNGYGIYLFSSSNSTLSSNTITTNGSTGYGILIGAGSNNNATSNKINATGINADGIYISDSDSNIISLNNITKSGRDGIRIQNSGTSIPERNNITNNIILNSTEHGIFANNTLNAFQLMQGNNISYSGNFSILLSNASNITIIGGSLEYSKIGLNATSSRNVTITNATFIGSTLWDFYITNNSWVISLNNSFNKSINVTNILNDYSNFTNQYYVDVNVTDPDSVAVSGAAVYAYENTTGAWSQEWTETAGGDGFTGKWATIEYTQNGTSIVNYTSNFTATKSTRANSTTKYITSSQQVDIRLPAITDYCNGSYTAGQTTWDITSNITCANETIYVAGNITIFNNGSLTLYNVTINFSAFAAGSNSINKSPNGGLYIYDLDSNLSTQEDATEIISNNSDNRYNFWVFGNGLNDNFTMQNSKLISSGYGARSLGIHLYNVSNVVIVGNNISGGLKFGLILNQSNNNNVSGNFINETAATNIVIYIDSSTSNTIQSNTLISDNNNARGIYLKRGSDSNIIRSNIITTTGNVDHGILSQLTNANLLIESNTITTTGNGSIGMYIQATSESNITRNKINTSGRNADSIYIFGDSNNNKVNLNNISNSGRSGIRLETTLVTALPERNNITDNIIINSTADGIFANNTLTGSQLIQGNNITYSGLNYAAIRLNNASNITIIGGIIENNTIGINASGSINITVANATFIGNTLWDFYITTNSWIVSLNNSFSKSAVNVTNVANDYSNFTNQYYVDVNVTQADSSFSAVSGAAVYAYENTTGAWAQEWTEPTGTNGFTGKWATIEYTQNGTTIVNYTSNFTASYSTKINSTAKYITSSQQVDVRIPAVTKFCNGNYTEGQATWNITSNVTCANQTIYVAGNITIFNNGSLTLYNVTINFSMFENGSSFINKSPNGGLFIYDLDSNASTQEDATEIISNNSDYKYDFWAFGNGANDNFTMQNSKVISSGYGAGSRGIRLDNVSNVRVTGNNISGGAQHGLFLQASANNNISNNAINTTATFGIFLVSSSNSNTLQSNTITTSGSLGRGIFLNSSSSSNITSNTITTSGSTGQGILLDAGSNSNAVQSNTIATSGDQGVGIYIAISSNSNTLQSNTITTSGIGARGIYLDSSSNNNATSNKINATSLNADGVYIFSNSGNNILSLNNISKSGRDGIRIEGSAENLPERNNITNNIILNSTEHGIFVNNTLTASQLIQGNNISYSGNFSLLLSNASNITIIGGSLEYSKIGVNATNSINVTVTNATFVLNTLWDFYITTNSWIVSLNNSFNKSGVNVTNYLGDFSNFTNQYYVDVNVTWSNSTAVSGATVFAYENSTGSWAAIWNETTASNGFTGKWATTEYFQNGTNIINYTSNFTANYSGQANSTIKYISSSQQVDVRLNSTAAPANFCNGSYTAGQATWDITSNITCANETIYVAGNITIFNNGSLTLYNVTINFSMFADGSGSINKSSNGGLFIYDLDSNASTQEDATEIISNNSNYEYDFWAFGNGLNDNLTIRNSKFTDAGYAVRSLGIYLYNVSNARVIGNNISGGAKRGFFLESSTNNNIINNTVNNDGIAVFLEGSSSNNISNNIITTSSANAHGILISVRSNLNLIQSNTITPSGPGSHGIQIATNSSSNNISSNKINITGTSLDGINLITTSNNNIINLNNITFARNGINVGDSATERNNITNNRVLNSTQNGIVINDTLNAYQFIYNNNITYSGLNYAGIFLNNASNITVIGGVLENNTIAINATMSRNVTITNATIIGSALWDFYITNNSWVISLNNSFNKSGVNVTNSIGDYSNFTAMWYVDVNVTWSNSSSVSGATVFAYENSTGSWVQRWTETTAGNGFTGKWATIEYVQNGTTVVNYTSNFTANYTTSANSTIKYITSSQQVDVRINVTAPPPAPSFNITFLITKTLSPDMVMAASNETINATTTVKVNKTTNAVSFINITDEIPYDFIYENESRISVIFINWSDAGSNRIDITANVTKTIVDYAGSVNTWLIINISNMSTSLGYYMTENDSIEINYLMNSSKMNANDTRIVYTNVTVKDIASNEAADFKLTNITSSQIVLRGYKKISADPNNPQNITVGIEMQSLGGKLTSILLADYLPSSISAKSQLVGLNVTYYNKTSNSYKTLTEPEDYKLYNPYNSTLPDGQLASVFSYNFSYNFTNWDGTIYDNDSILINYSIAIVGGGTWILPAIIGGWDPQYQKQIKTETYSQALVPLFDVISRVLTPKIKPGEDVKALLQMLNVGGPKARVDVFITYSMKTMNGELITERSETIAVFEQKEKELVLPTPSAVKPGMYTFETIVAYAGREAASTDVFEVLGEKGSGFSAQWLMFGIFGLVMVLIIIFVIIRTRKKEQ